MADTFTSIWNEVHGHAEAVDPLLVQSWVRDTWRDIAERRTWSWLRKKGVLSIAAPYTTGTVELTPGEQLATFTGATLTDAMIGRQFRSGSHGTIYDIEAIDSGAGTATLSHPWADTDSSVTGQSYKIFTCYLVPPDSEFFGWIAVKDPNHRKRLRLHINQEEIDYHDPQRTMTSRGPACLSGLDWTRSYSGKVHSTLQVVGSGAAPTASGNYSGQTDSVYIVKITTGGARGTAVFSYQKDDGTVVTGQTTAAVVSIAESITLSFPVGTYVLNDVFVFRVSPRPAYGVPRYEIYPHPTAAIYLPVTYSVRVADIDSPGFALPYTMRGDIIKLGALARLARYPGTDNKPNPYAQVARAEAHEDRFEWEMGKLETSDNYIMEQNVKGGEDVWEYALLPWMTSSGTGLRATQDYDPLDLLL